LGRILSASKHCGTEIHTSKPESARPKAGQMADDALVAAFDEQMLLIYQRALSEAGYKASRFLQMLHDHRGLETARILLHSATISEGYGALYQRGRLDLTVEAVIYDNARWHPLFSEEELAICTKRLEEYKYIRSRTSSKPELEN
jgi:hypothetical protein